MHETVFVTDLEGARSHYEKEEPRGECVLVIEGKSRRKIREESIAEWEVLSVEEHMEYYTGRGIDRKEAMKLVARDRGVGKRDIYQMLLKNR